MKFAVIYKTGGIVTHETFKTAAEAYGFKRELEIEGITEVVIKEVRR